ncbi:DedA family protein [Conexibacter sp. DBS9H8]|uniref:DedA family protein n=1 Tax=Conexibacter sp. DBS9H8 TaxID=2937801 RepID=UPI00200BA4EC|nr:DedA family protein [Conexibacter sp. DBS9H8]
MIGAAAIIAISGSLGYFLPAIIGLESMGVPSPGETALLLAAVLASQGKLQIWLVIVIAIASAMAGDNLGYLLGRRLGREVVGGPGPFQARRRHLIAVGDRFFDRHGPKTVFLGRWVSLVRFIVAWLAGINEMPFRVFFLWNALGAVTWATAYGLAGYFGGHAVETVFKDVGLGAGIALGVAIVAVIVVLKLRERRAGRRESAETEPGAPSARAASGDTHTS